MFHIFFAIAIFIALFTAIGIGVITGKKFGLWIGKHHKEKKPGTVAVAEGTIFAILGLLIAFTYSGAYDRFEERKVQIIDEFNAYETVYQRLDLLTPTTQPALKKLLVQYLDVRLHIYQNIPDMSAVYQAISQSQALKNTIWKLTFEACNKTNKESTTELLIPAMNELFDQTNKGYALSLIHTPGFIYALLIFLAILGSVLTGYSIAESRDDGSLHILSYITIATLTIFVIINLELPRLGVIRLDDTDKILTNLKTEWGK